jgi:DNA-binding MarR family transcriptional regulator
VNIETPTLARRRLRTWLRLLQVTRGTENHLREFLRVNHGTTLPRFDVMATLYRNADPMKMSDLSRKLLVSNGNATTVVDRLEKDGLAQRLPSETDRRAVLVRLTKAGRTEFEQQAVAHAAEIDKLFGNLNDADLDHLRDIFRRMKGDGND